MKTSFLGGRARATNADAKHLGAATGVKSVSVSNDFEGASPAEDRGGVGLTELI